MPSRPTEPRIQKLDQNILETQQRDDEVEENENEDHRNIGSDIDDYDVDDYDIVDRVGSILQGSAGRGSAGVRSTSESAGLGTAQAKAAGGGGAASTNSVTSSSSRNNTSNGRLIKAEVIIAALEILHKKKKRALEAHEYAEAGKIHGKMEKLETSLGLKYEDLIKNPALQDQFMSVDGEYGTIEKDGAHGSLSGIAVDGAVLNEAFDKNGKLIKPSFFSAANPFRTYQLLRSTGYSKKSSCGMLCGIYFVVFILEIAVLRLGLMILDWKIAEPEEGGALLAVDHSLSSMFNGEGLDSGIQDL